MAKIKIFLECRVTIFSEYEVEAEDLNSAKVAFRALDFDKDEAAIALAESLVWNYGEDGETLIGQIDERDYDEIRLADAVDVAELERLYAETRAKLKARST